MWNSYVPKDCAHALHGRTANLGQPVLGHATPWTPLDNLYESTLNLMAPRDLMRPFLAGPMRMWPISPRVNKPENDDPSIVEPIAIATSAA